MNLCLFGSQKSRCVLTLDRRDDDRLGAATVRCVWQGGFHPEIQRPSFDFSHDFKRALSTPIHSDFSQAFASTKLRSLTSFGTSLEDSYEAEASQMGIFGGHGSVEGFPMDAWA